MNYSRKSLSPFVYSLVFCLTIASAGSSSFAYGKGDDNTALGVGVSLLAGIGVAVGVYAAGYLGGFWGYESNEEMIARAERLHAIAIDYRPMIDMCHTFERYNREDDLYRMAFARRGQGRIDIFISSIEVHAKNFKHVSSSLRDRAQKVQRDKQLAQKGYIAQIMHELADQLERDVRSIQDLLTMLKQHAVYFRMFEQEDYLGNEYINELRQMGQHYDLFTLRSVVNAHALHCYPEKGVYAILFFVKKLKRDIADLECLLRSSDYTYVNRVAYARDLIGKLRYIEQFITSHADYIKLELAYRLEQQEKERLNLEREHIAIERRQLALQERAIDAQETANLIKTAELGHAIATECQHRDSVVNVHIRA